MIKRSFKPLPIFAGLAAALLAVVLVTVVFGDQTASPEAAATVDFSRVVGGLDPYSIGVGASTYGASPLNSAGEQAAERRLDARVVRVPVGIRGGELSSSAAGAQNVDVQSLVERYLSWGYHVLVVIGGETNDFDVQPGDTTKIVTALGYGPNLQYSTPNEPTGQGKSIGDDIAVAREILTEGRAVYPDFKIWGPVWAFYDPAVIKRFIRAIGTGLAGIDFHHYAMGQTSISTDAAMKQTPTIGSEVAAVRHDLRAGGIHADVAVDELNLSWRYDDGPGGAVDNRFFTSVDTTWIASACGHIMLAGGACLPYATQNGALGMTVEDGGPNPDSRPVTSPMPAYWGIAAWTGAGLFPHATGSFYSVSNPTSGLEVFASGNESGGDNIVAINKTAQARSVMLSLHSVAHGTYRTWTTNPNKPYAPLRAKASASYSGSVPVTVPPLAVAVCVLAPKKS